MELEVGGKTLWARISPWARDELAIKPGLWLYAQIKKCVDNRLIKSGGYK